MALKMPSSQYNHIKQLSKYTVTTIHYICNGIVSLCRHLLTTSHKYVLVEQMIHLRKEFSKLRQGSGCTYFINVQGNVNIHAFGVKPGYQCTSYGFVNICQSGKFRTIAFWWNKNGFLIHNRIYFPLYVTDNMFELIKLITALPPSPNSQHCTCPVGWGCRIHRLLLCSEVDPPPMSVLDMTLNNLMVRFQWCKSFREYEVPFLCHCSHVHSGPEW